MTYSYHSTGQITFNNTSGTFTTVPTKDRRWELLKWKEENDRRNKYSTSRNED